MNHIASCKFVGGRWQGFQTSHVVVQFHANCWTVLTGGVFVSVSDLFVCDAICAALDGDRWAGHARRLMHPIAREAAEMAVEAGVGALALMHIGRFADPANIQAEAAAIFPGPLTVPEYLHSYTPVLKNALDWASRPRPLSALRQKPVALMGAGGGSGTIRAQLAIRPVLSADEAYLMPKPELYIVNAAQYFDADGTLRDESIRAAVRDVVVALAAWTRRLRAD